MIKEYTRSHRSALAFEFNGRLDESDYPEMIKLVDETIAQYGEINLLLRFHDFSGWTPSGFWRDFRFSRNHSDSIRRLAVVGEAAWQKALIEIAKPLTKAEVKYFPVEEKDAAWAWIDQTPAPKSERSVPQRG